jgi:hypothetical protein
MPYRTENRPLELKSEYTLENVIYKLENERNHNTLLSARITGFTKANENEIFNRIKT